MNAAIWTGVNNLEWREVPTPELRPGEALVRVHGVGVCGSDLHIWQGHTPDRTPPLILGHEVAGEVVAVRESDRVKEGDLVTIYPPLGCETCVYCRQGREALCRNKKPRGIYAPGGFAEYLRIQTQNLLRIDMEQAKQLGSGWVRQVALVEPLATALHFVNSARDDHGSGAILGVGPIGLLILQVAKMRGFPKIAAIEMNPNRAAAAQDCGADLVVDPVNREALQKLEDFFGQDGCNVVWNTAGVGAARSLALNLVRSAGLIVEIGLSEPETKFDFDQLIKREIRVAGSYAYTRAEFAEAGELLQTNRIDGSRWVSCAPLSTIQNVFQELTRTATTAIKVILQP